MAKTAIQIDAFGKPKRIRYLPAEHDEQVALVTWLQWMHREAWEHCYAIPNGGHRHQAVAKRMKDEGVKRGVPDLCLALPSRHWHGLYLELKASGTTACSVSKEQRAWIERLREAGYAAEVAHGLDEAKRVIEGYLDDR
jgi:hypothetical protein